MIIIFHSNSSGFYQEFKQTIMKHYLILAFLWLNLTPLLAQGLILENQKGKRVSFPPGEEIILFGAMDKEYDKFEMKGKVVVQKDSFLVMDYLYLNRQSAMGLAHENYQTMKFGCYQNDNFNNVKLSQINVVASPKYRKALVGFGGPLFIGGALCALVLGPILGAFSNSEARFSQTVPGKLSIWGSAAVVTGVSLLLISDTKKKYKIREGHASPRRNWKIVPQP